jgi:hypothetical protein
MSGCREHLCRVADQGLAFMPQVEIGFRATEDDMQQLVYASL